MLNNVPIVDKGQAKSKAITVGAIMGNERLNKLMQEALDAPVGSAKRDRARSVMKSLWRTNRNRAINDDSDAGMAQQGQQQDQQMLMEQMGQLEEKRKQDPTFMTMLPPPPTSISEQPQPTPLTVGPGAQPKVDPRDPYRGKFIVDATGNVVPHIQGLDPVETRTTKTVAPSTVQMVPQNMIGPQQAPAGYTAPVGTSNADSSMDYSSYYDTWFDGLDSEQQEKWKTLYEAVNTGIGQSAFAFQVMSDKEELKKMFPGVPEEWLPDGALLSGQLADLKNTIYKESGLEQQLSNLNNLKRRGATLKTDLADYVRGRDEYLGQLDGMITGAKDKMAGMDMANPHVNERMNKYMNYLYVLKGRQEKRYVDYVNTSIEQHNADLSFSQEQYNIGITKYQDELATQGAIKTEQYNYFKGMLGDLYTNLAGQEQLQHDRMVDNLALSQAQANLLKTIADANKTNAETANIGVEDAKVSSADIKYYTDLLSTINPEEGAYDLGDYYGLMGQAVDEGYSSDAVKSRYGSSVAQLASKEASKGSFLSFWGDMSEVLNSIGSSGKDEAETDGIALSSKVINNLVRGMDDYMVGDNYNIQGVRETLKDLTGWSTRGAEYDVDEKDKFKKKNQGKVSDDMLDFLFDNYSRHIEQHPLKEIYDLKKNDNDLASDILVDYDSWLRGQAMNSITG